MQQKRATLKDVAGRSGVSITTASFVLNSTPGQTIPLATQNRVRQVADELGYTAHGVARALREGSARIVLLNTGHLPHGRSIETFIHGLEDELSRLDHALLVVQADRSSDAFRSAVAAIAPRAVIDIGAIYAREDAESHDGGWTTGLASHARTQIDHLYATGHRDIAVAVPGEDATRTLVALRLAHADTITRDLHMSAPVALRLSDRDSPAVPEIRALRAEHPDVTAVAAFNDDTAFRVLAAMTDLGLQAPGDLAVIGFDDSHEAPLWRPALTSIRIDAEIHGRRAAHAVLGLEKPELQPPPSQVIIRTTA